MSVWQIACDEGNMVVNVETGVYYGESTSDVRNTRGRLFSTTLVHGCGPDYHCIAWNEL